MAIAFVESKTGSATSSPTVSTAFAGSLSPGQLVVATTGDDSGLATNGVTGVTLSDGTTLTRVSTASSASSASESMWWGIVATGGAGITASMAWNVVNTARGVIIVQYFNGFLGTPTPDKSVSVGGSSTAPNSGATAATTQANELVVAGMACDGIATTISLAGSFTNLGSVNVANASTGQSSQIVSSTGAQTGQFSLAASRNWQCGVLTFYDLSTGGSSGLGGWGGRRQFGNGPSYIASGDGMSVSGGAY